MTLSYKTLLTISCVSLSLHSMEQNTLTTNNSLTNTNPILNNQNFYHINDLYKKTYNTLENYKPDGVQSITALSEIITKIKELKTQNIHEKTIGLFAYKQRVPSTTNFFSFEKTLYHNPLYVSIFFEQLAQYNAHLEKNEFTSPTVKEFAQYINNKKRTAVIEKAATFRLYIDLQKIDPEKKIIQDIPLSVATRDFEKFSNDIALMQQVTPEEIRTLAHILYGFDSTEKQPESPEKL